MSAPAATEALLEGLNEPQREAVLHGDGPLLILAGAGSGKTRVLTHRIAHLVTSGAVRPSEILAITFTNKAAGEMRERVEALVGARARAMWVMTFHSACARMLRSDAQRLGYTRGFTIYDEQDSLRLVKACMDELDVDPKRFAPRGVRRQISEAKNQLLDAEAYRLKVSSFFEQTAADVYERYEQRSHSANAMDFDDLLFRCVNLFELFPEVRDRYRRSFRHVLVDEYQDTNRAQYRWLQLLCEEHRNLAVVGDDDQCLVEGTEITMGDGELRPIEAVEEGDYVLSCHGSGDFRPARVSGVSRSQATEGVAITTAAGRRIVSTAEHMHFAGYDRRHSPLLHLTYVMWRADKGFRVGTTRTYPERDATVVSGVHLRAVQEHADAAWVVSTHAPEAEARVAEIELSLRYRLPTLPFTARSARWRREQRGRRSAQDRRDLRPLSHRRHRPSAPARPRPQLRPPPPRPADLRRAAAQRDRHPVRRPARPDADASGRGRWSGPTGQGRSGDGRLVGAAGEAGQRGLEVRILLQELRQGDGGRRPDPNRDAGDGSTAGTAWLQ